MQERTKADKLKYDHQHEGTGLEKINNHSMGQRVSDYHSTLFSTSYRVGSVTTVMTALAIAKLALPNTCTVPSHHTACTANPSTIIASREERPDQHGVLSD
jgi:hypothetical protein